MASSLKLSSLRRQRDRLRADAKRGERGGENVYLDPYSHIDQSSVEVRLARDNNDPDLGTRHVSVLLSSCVIDPVGLLSAAWIHSRAPSPRHTAVTGHKEGSISTAPRCLTPPPACAFRITPSAARESERGGGGGGRRHTKTATTERESRVKKG